MDDARLNPATSVALTNAQVRALHDARALLAASLVPAPPEAIRVMVAKLSIAFPRQNLSDAEAEVRLEQYEVGLEDMPADVLERAYRAAIRTYKFFPTVAELRALCGGLAMRSWRLARIDAMLTFRERRVAEGRPEPTTYLPPPPGEGRRDGGGTASFGDVARRLVRDTRGDAPQTAEREGTDNG